MRGRQQRLWKLSWSSDLRTGRAQAGLPPECLSQSLSIRHSCPPIARRAKSAAHESSPPEQALQTREVPLLQFRDSSRESEDLYQNANWTPFPSPSSNEGNKIHASQAACPESSLRPSSLMSSFLLSFLLLFLLFHPPNLSHPSHSLSPIHHRVRTEVHAKQLQVAFPGRVSVSKRTRCWSLWAVISGDFPPRATGQAGPGQDKHPNFHCVQGVSTLSGRHELILQIPG